jgi:hypothetical protein
MTDKLRTTRDVTVEPVQDRVTTSERSRDGSVFSAEDLAMGLLTNMERDMNIRQTLSHHIHAID